MLPRNRMKREPKCGETMEALGVVLIAVSGGDIASTNQADVVRNLGTWTQRSNVEGHPSYECGDIRMWVFPNGVLREDNINHRWESVTGEVVSEVIFPSRHVAESGRACLTLHPIGAVSYTHLTLPTTPYV